MLALMSRVRHVLVFLTLALGAGPTAAEEATPAALPPGNASVESEGATAKTAEEPPTDWIDQATGHRIIRLSRDPGTSTRVS